jgi:hypothetical protein
MSANIPLISVQSPAVDFIDNRAGDLIDAFKAPRSQYDHISGEYKAVGSSSMPGTLSTTPEDGSDEELPRGQALPKMARMAFWNKIFAQSMTRFKALHPNEPDNRVKSGVRYGIRSETTWEGVYAQLQNAREVYDGDKRGFWGKYQKTKRWLIDNSSPVLEMGIKFVPNGDYTSPVVAAVQVFLDVSFSFFFYLRSLALSVCTKLGTYA